MEPLAERFEHRLRDTIRECIALGYHPHRFEEMLNAYGGQQTAKRLVASGELQDGIRRLAAMAKLDLTMEHIMLQPEFEPLFTPGELDAARWRLAQFSSRLG
jgi:hypothetical protein